VEIQNDEKENPLKKVHLNIGIYEFSVFCICAILTSIILGKVQFGTIYPFF